MKEQDMQKNKKYILVIIGFLMSVLCFLGLAVQVWSDRTQKVSIKIGTEDAVHSEVSVWVEVTKSWADFDADGKPCYGGQYDCFVENHMSASLIDWELNIVLPAETRIDSSWNGEFQQQDGVIHFVPDNTLDVARVKSGATESFGLILYSDEVLHLNTFEIIGHKYAEVYFYPLFYIGCIIAALTVIVLTWQITFDIRTRKLEQRRINDEKIIMETMHTLANFIDAKDEYTRGHSTRVSAYSVKIARKMHLPEDEVRHLSYIALMHDCGKMGIPDSILNKPGRLTEEERHVIEQHTVMGGKILENMTSIPGVRDGALYHHERYDGKGYPEGLSGTDIPLYARIIGVADSFDAMNSDRCYRKRLPMEMIKKELQENAGKQFDPEIVKHMVRVIEEKDFA